jgi:hypothetical protein
VDGCENILKILLGKNALKCYKSLKEGLGTHVSLNENQQWANSIKNGGEETGDAPCSGAPISATDERHLKQVKSVLEHTCSISCMAVATEVGISPASVCHILTNSLGE